MPAFRSSPANIETVKSDAPRPPVVAGPFVFDAGQIASDYKTDVPEQARRHVLNRATLIGVVGALAAALVVITSIPRRSWQSVVSGRRSAAPSGRSKAAGRFHSGAVNKTNDRY
jgi:hypothetical protein